MAEKLNLFDKIKKRKLIREKEEILVKKFGTISNSRLRNDKELQEKIWNAQSSSEIDFDIFSDEFLIGKHVYFSIFPTEISRLKHNLQRKLFEDYDFAPRISNFSPEIQLEIFQENKNNIALRYLSEEAQITYLRENIQKVQEASENVQVILGIENYDVFCQLDEYEKKKCMEKAEYSNAIWQNLTYDDFEKFRFDNYEIEKIMKKRFAKNQDRKKIEKICESGKVKRMEKAEMEFYPIEQQRLFFENRRKMYDGYDPRFDYRIFNRELLKQEFEKKYGKDKLEEYKTFISELLDSDQKLPVDSLRLLEVIFNEQSIVEKNNVTQLREYMEENDEKKKKEIFNDIIERTYGKRARQIVEERKELLLEDFDNTEILLPEIIDNFRKGFVEDLISYNFNRYDRNLVYTIDDFIDIVKNPEKLKAYKYFYNLMAGEIGENVITMQATMERYSEFNDILIEASNMELSAEEQKKLLEVCTWRRNIGRITEVGELRDADSMILRAIKDNKNILELFMDNILTRGLDNERILYDYPRDLLISEGQLLSYIKQNPEKITGIFLENRKKLNEIKSNSIKNFQENIITDRSKIEEKAKKGEDGVKIIKIGELEIIDLGSMSVRFGAHCPTMNNSMLGKATADIQNGIGDRYMTYDKKWGISTISTSPSFGPTLTTSYKTYIYWDFHDNEFVSFSSEDGRVSHGGKLIISKGRVEQSLKNFNNLDEKATGFGELAFYRRKRSHDAIEKVGGSGRVIPSAILGSPSCLKDIKIALERFGKSVPIITRGGLENPKNILEIQKALEQYYKRVPEIYLVSGFQNSGIRTSEIQDASEIIKETIRKRNENEKTIENDVKFI